MNPSHTRLAPTRSFRHLHPGDFVTRLLAGTIPVQVCVTAIDGDLVRCGSWTFDRDTGIEVDEELGWGPAFGVTGSYLVDPFDDDAPHGLVS